MIFFYRPSFLPNVGRPAHHSSFLRSVELRAGQSRNLLGNVITPKKKRDRHDSRMTRMHTPRVIPSQGWAVRLIEKESRGRKLTELSKK
jgi:hypothetical protein